MSFFRVLALVLAGLVVAGAASARQDGSGAQPTPPAAATPLTPEAFRLGDLSGLWPDRFVLFKDAWLPGPDDGLFGPPSLWGGAQAAPPPRLVGLRTFGLSVQLGEEVGPEGRRRIVLTPLYRSWDNLDGWEKFAVTLQYAGAAAAVGHFVGKLVH